ncbi:MAG: ATP-binding protein, partial [Anaerolineales bacterium]
VLVPRLGDSLVEKGLLTRADLKKGLAHQAERAAAGETILLGQALIELGLIDRKTLDRAVTEQIAQLQEALRQSNLFLEQRVEQRTAELQEALDKLTELNRLKNDFISNVSHELRTPLSHMVGYIDLLSAEALGGLSDEQKSAIAVLQKSYRRLSSLIDNLLFLSFDSDESLHLEPSAMHIQELVHIVCEQQQSRAQSEEVILSEAVPPDLPAVMADSNKLEWALNQLAENAIKFNQKGGRVNVSAVLQGKRLLITVADTGVGIPEGKIGEVFDPFHQLDSSSTRRVGGAGIGLTLTKRIIEAHGSKLEIESHVGKGTRVSFSLPVVQKPA